MEGTNKKLAALNSDSIRGLVNAVNEERIKKEDLLGQPIYQDGSYYLLYFKACN